MGARLSPAGGNAYAIPHNSSLNVTPFVDVLLVLLIIFMVALPLATTSHKLDLPPARGTGAPTAPPVYVTLRQDGSVVIGERASTLATLPADVAAVVGGENPYAERIYLRADRGVRYEAFMDMMNRMKGGGFKRLALVNEES